jgi:hypothetical protein
MPELQKTPDRSFDEQARAMERANNSMLNMLDAAGWKQLAQGFWEESARWQNNLQKQVAHKAFNVPLMEGLNATTTNTVRNGLGWKELFALAAIAGGGLWYAGNGESSVATPNPAPPAAAPIAQDIPIEDREYQIIHRDANGNIVNVLPWPGAAIPAEIKPLLAPPPPDANQ